MCVFIVSETSASLDRAAYCQNIVMEHFGEAVDSSFMEKYFNNDTRVAVSITSIPFDRRTLIRVGNDDDVLIDYL